MAKWNVVFDMAFDLRAELFKIERVLRIASRPREKEFWHMAKVTALGIVAIGILGIIVSSVFHLI